MTGIIQPLAGYPNPSFFLGSFATDPTNPAPGQWWYNTTSMQIKGNVNGTIQIFGAFASSFSSTTYIVSNTTIGGSGITVNYVNLVISNNATLTIAAGTTVNVAGVMNITAGSTVIMQGATVNIYNALQNAGTLNSTSSSDSIQAVQIQNTGTINMTGKLYMPSAGYNHILAGTISGSGTINIQGTAIILINDSLSLLVQYVTGPGTLQIQQNAVCTINNTIIMSLATVSGTGTLSISSGYELEIYGNITFSVSTVTGQGIIIVMTNYTLTIQGNVTISVSQLQGYGTLSIPSGNVLILTGGISLGVSTITGSGSISINGQTLTINANTTFSVGTVMGSGPLSISSGYTLTQAGNITISVPNVNVYGTWANAGYNITIPSSSTVVWNTKGSLTTASTPGTLTVNGTCYYYGTGITLQNSNAVPTFPLNLAGTGIFIATPASGGVCKSFSLSSTVINANAGDGSATGSGVVPSFSLSSITGSATGKYGLGVYDSTANTYTIFILIYIGTASTAFSVSSSQYLGSLGSDTSGDTIQVWNASGSAGSLTLSGTVCV
jgi:hypothetical protein